MTSASAATATVDHYAYDNSRNNSLDDIFGSSPDEHQNANVNDRSYISKSDEAQTSATAEPSDLPSLRRQHVTAGYRDGIAQSKSEHVQSGFDGGYPVGAQFGLRVGTILGVLEGVLGGLEATATATGPVKKMSAATKRASLRESTKLAGNMEEIGQGEQMQMERIERIKQLYRNALKELDVEALFSGLKAENEGESDEGYQQEAGSGFTAEMKPENRLRQKADPVVAKWEKLVDVTRWEENMEAIDSMEDQNVFSSSLTK